MFNTALTLICNPSDKNALAPAASGIDEIVETFSQAPSKRQSLGDGAVDILFTLNNNRSDQLELSRIVKKHLGDLPIDVAIQPIETRAKRLLIADMDSTMIEQECIDELADFVGKRAEISDITERAMRGELDFDAALTERVAMLEGLGTQSLQQAFAERITLTPGAKTLVQTMRARGAYTALVSGGFTFFTERVASACGFHINQANTLLINHDKLTGKVGLPILGRAAKEDALLAFASSEDIPLSDTLAVGDGANDLSMLGAAGLGVAFHAKPAVAAAADIAIDHGDLTALLYLQGITQSEFVAD